LGIRACVRVFNGVAKITNVCGEFSKHGGITFDDVRAVCCYTRNVARRSETCCSAAWSFLTSATDA
jgi:hypothetical protein